MLQCLSIRMRMDTSNNKHSIFLDKNNENTYTKGRALMQMYRVVPQTTKRGSTFQNVPVHVKQSIYLSFRFLQTITRVII